ncbi:MAG TPA: PspC domain-containing protein [Candidatus Eisenbacteria bacterium]|jgi:phage shock protein C|nr:PspC domain-containing protein [Candidatus Eisenbacteria bacterium]
MAERRLYRSRRDRKIAGVCGGMAQYWGIDPVIPRLIWVAFALAAGAGFLAYLICWLVIPNEPAGQPATGS